MLGSSHRLTYRWWKLPTANHLELVVYLTIYVLFLYLFRFHAVRTSYFFFTRSTSVGEIDVVLSSLEKMCICNKKPLTKELLRSRSLFIADSCALIHGCSWGIQRIHTAAGGLAAPPFMATIRGTTRWSLWSMIIHGNQWWQVIRIGQSFWHVVLVTPCKQPASLL